MSLYRRKGLVSAFKRGDFVEYDGTAIPEVWALVVNATSFQASKIGPESAPIVSGINR